MLIGLVYHISICELNEVLLDGLNTWSQSGRCLILGDFNAPMVGWRNLRIELSVNSFEQELDDEVITRAIVQHVKEATRYYSDSESSLPDLILTHYKDDVTNLSYMPPLGKIDHVGLIFDFYITVNHEHTPLQPRPNVQNAKIEDIKYSASSKDWTTEPENPIGLAGDVFRNFHLKVTALHIPWATPRVARKCPP